MSYAETTRIAYADTTAVDAFGKLRVSSPRTLMESKLVGDDDPLRWDDAEASGSGTTSVYDQASSSIVIGVGNTTTGTRVRQTRERAAYNAGKSQLINMTFVLGAKATGITRRVGYFSDANGVFLEQTASDLRFVVRNQSSDTATGQSSWNFDKFDGTGPSGITLDETKLQLLYIDFSWLGTGRVRFGFFVDGKFCLAHSDSHTNVDVNTYMGVPNQPLRYEIANDGTGATATMRCICTSISTEGGTGATGEEHGVYSTLISGLSTGAVYPILALRKRTSFDATEVVTNSTSFLCTSSEDFRWGIYLLQGGSGLTGTAFSFSAVTNSALEIDKSPTTATTITGGVLLKTGLVSTTNSHGSVAHESETPIPLGTDLAGNRDILVLGIELLSGSSKDFYGAINWVEIR